ncbi:MAG: 3-phosphoserine/phosphohydroxythreonine transaminase [Planctomycetia bacterium]|nr:3-phosphoserine/phosphohydroxythreonine transaminase [Planctomycetia bacterium]
MDTPRVFNFSPGPATLPLPVLEQAQREMLSLPGLGVSAMEISHRSKWFEGVLDETTANFKKLLHLPDEFSVLYMQGGSRLQFSTVPMNLLRGTGKPADYVITGTWGTTAAVEARREGTVNVAFDNKAENYRRLPHRDELKLSPDAAYVHITSNETIQGVQYQVDPEWGAAPVVCDASSDFLCRPIHLRPYGMIYACAQKNLGPAGVTVVLVRSDLLERVPQGLHSMLDYRLYAKEKSLANTPPVFACYIVLLVTRWLLHDVGGLAHMHERNRKKAALLYEVVDRFPDLYQGHADPACRSLMNVTFRLPSDEHATRFVQEAAKRSLCELKGHRSVGGIRASIYNAMPIEGVEALREFMLDFARRA